MVENFQPWSGRISRTVLPAAAGCCLARVLLPVVVQVMGLIGGRHLLSADRPGDPAERGGCASGNDGEAGDFFGWAKTVGIFFVRKEC